MPLSMPVLASAPAAASTHPGRRERSLFACHEWPFAVVQPTLWAASSKA
jgi:hypothetical protein